VEEPTAVGTWISVLEFRDEDQLVLDYPEDDVVLSSGNSSLDGKALYNIKDNSGRVHLTVSSQLVLLSHAREMALRKTRPLQLGD
jgi:hypothetical protein